MGCREESELPEETSRGKAEERWFDCLWFGCFCFVVVILCECECGVRENVNR